jgi:two-component system response regulator AtoC
MADRPLRGAEMIGSPLIMVIDDDESVRSALTDLLQDEGYRVVAFADGGDGLGYLSAGETPDLVLLDLMLPTVDGWRFRAEQVMNPVLASIPVIVVTAAPATAHDSELDGDVDVVRKPFETRTLLSRIRRHCPPADPTAADADESRRTA